MKLKHLPLLLAVIAFSLAACKKENATVSKADVVLSVTNTGSTVSVNKGQTISVTLGNPGDGNYYFDPVIYTSTILSLNGHTHADPKPDASGHIASGNAGTDTWIFTAIHTGQTSITITASRPNGVETSQMFNSTITVK